MTKKINIRPVSLKEYIGQEEVKKKMNVLIKSWKNTKRVIGHTLCSGGPGLGKSTIARAIAHDARVQFVEAHAQMLKTEEDLFELFRPNGGKLGRGSIIFIDEAQCLNGEVQSVLLTILEDQRVANGDKTITLPEWTFILGSTNPEKLSSPLQDRMKNTCTLEYYTKEELYKIGKATAYKLGVNVAEEALFYLASICFGTPRYMNNFVENLDVYCGGFGIKEFTMDDLEDFLKFVGIDGRGMGRNDRAYVSALYNNIVNGTRKPMGLKMLSKKTRVSEGEIETMIEKKMLYYDMMVLDRGRQLTDEGLKYYENYIKRS